MKKLLKITLTFVITIIVVTGIIIPEIILGTPASPAVGNWYQQFMPNLNGRTISDIFFLDSLTGWAVTPYRFQNDTAFIFKTTNSGDTWFFVNIRIGQFVGYNKIKFLNSNTGFICGASQTSGYKGLSKSTDGGSNWTSLNVPVSAQIYEEMSVLNEDTIWLVASESFTGGVFFTSNGGTSWVQQYSAGTQNPEKIYMYNTRIGFISDNSGASSIRKTTNGGLNWNMNVSGEYYRDIIFTDSLTGWYSYGNNVYKTTNGGNNWQLQILPFGGNLISVGINEFSAINKDTLFAVGAEIITGMQTRGIIYRTVNGGANWTFQVPDTSIYVPGPYNYMQFSDKYHGWAYTLGFYGGIHTTTGGDPIWLTAIEQTSNVVPKDFILHQNYPNPFNPVTNIKFDIPKRSNVVLRVYDVTGRMVSEIYNGLSDPGEYTADFDAVMLSSGVYYYEITANTPNGGVIFKDVKKMVVVK